MIDKQKIKCLFGHHDWQHSPKFPVLQDDNMMTIFHECSNCGLLKHQFLLPSVHCLNPLSPGGMFSSLQVDGKETSPKEYKRIEKKINKNIRRNYTYKNNTTIEDNILHPWPHQVKRLHKLQIGCFKVMLGNMVFAITIGMIFDNHSISWLFCLIPITVLSFDIICMIRELKVKKEFRKLITAK